MLWVLSIHSQVLGNSTHNEVYTMLVNRYLTESEISNIAYGVATGAANGNNNAVSTIQKTFVSPSIDYAADYYGVSLNRSQALYIAKRAQIDYGSIIRIFNKTGVAV